MNADFQVVEAFLSGWKPFADLPAGTALRDQILAFLGEVRPEERRRHFASASDLYRLHNRYRELELFREGKNEKAEQFERLFRLSIAEFATAIEENRQKEHLGLLQFSFEFGRHEVAPRHNLMREFIYKLFEMDIAAVGIKYSLFPGGVLYSSAGKSHDEMARDYTRLGMGGAPMAGGVIARAGMTEFLYDTNSTAYKSTGDPAVVKDSLSQWIRNTGGREHKVRIRLDTTRVDV